MTERQKTVEQLTSAAPDVPPDVAVKTPEEELLGDPPDFSAVGGPENEPAYGRSRALAGEYPFNDHGGPYDRDEPSQVERGGIQTHHHAPDPAARSDGR
jgi:hypothetical protein